MYLFLDVDPHFGRESVCLAQNSSSSPDTPFNIVTLSGKKGKMESLFAADNLTPYIVVLLRDTSSLISHFLK